MKKTKYPKGWTAARVQRVVRHYEEQAETDAVAEDEAAFAKDAVTVMKVPAKLVSAVRQLIAKQKGLSHPVIDAIVALVDSRLAANRKKAAA